MTTLNTIIEEESNALEKKIGNFTFNNGGALELTLWDIVDERVHETDEVGTVINDHLTTAIQRAYEAGQSEERAMACKCNCATRPHTIECNLRHCPHAPFTPDKTEV